MRTADAPAAGWYPDPESRTRLRWWDGLDWTDIRRAPPSDVELVRGAAAVPPAQQQVGDQQYSQYPPGLQRADTQQIISEVRNVARAEVDRAAQEFTIRAQSAVRDVSPLITSYTNRIIRLVKLALGVATFLFIAWLLFQAIASQSFFDWLGDRIDNLTDESGSPLDVSAWYHL